MMTQGATKIRNWSKYSPRFWHQCGPFHEHLGPQEVYCCAAVERHDVLNNIESHFSPVTSQFSHRLYGTQAPVKQQPTTTHLTLFR